MAPPSAADNGNGASSASNGAAQGLFSTPKKKAPKPLDDTSPSILEGSGGLSDPLLRPSSVRSSDGGTPLSRVASDQLKEQLSSAHLPNFHEPGGLAARVYVFVLFTQVVQMLMSYDGGATQFCTDALARAGWSPFWLGLLGAMDKFGQVATAFVWGELLMRWDAKRLLVAGLFWKAACCFLFGRLQQQSLTVFMQLCMLSAKLGMGITEALVSVWATVWVQRNAPADSRAFWLSLAGTSAGIGSGIGSGVASLWDPIYAFFVQAAVLLGVWVAMVFTPGRLLRLGSSAARGGGAGASVGEEADAVQNRNPRSMLACEVARALDEVRVVDIVTLESMRLPGHFLDASIDPQEEGWKVRITRGDPSEIWAQFRLTETHGDIITLETLRLPDHYLVASSAKPQTIGCSAGSCMPQDKLFGRPEYHKLRLRECDGSETGAQFRVHPLVGRAIYGNTVCLESVRFPHHYMDATAARFLTNPTKGTKVCVTRGNASEGNWAQFIIRRQRALQLPGGFATESADSVIGRLSLVLRNWLWFWSAMAISLSCFVMSGVAFLWQNTVRNLWGYSNALSFAYFIFSTGVGGLLGVTFGGPFFDRNLGGFDDMQGKALCLRWCKRMMFAAALCATGSALLLGRQVYHNLDENSDETVSWHLYVLVASVFAIFFFVNAVMGTLYGINTDSSTPELRTFAAGLTVSFQNVFGYAFGPLLPSTVAEVVGAALPGWWPDVAWHEEAIAGARYAAGMAVALAMVWVLFMAIRFAEVDARVMKIRARSSCSFSGQNLAEILEAEPALGRALGNA